MNFKKMLIVLIAGILLTSGFTVTTFASSSKNVTVALPTFKITLNNKVITDNADNRYPLLLYKDITYFPMTYNFCRDMDLVSQWVQGQGLYIAAKPNGNKAADWDCFIPYALNGTVNKEKMSAAIVNYPVYIDGEAAPVDKTYPLLSFRDITYFPMTWTYGHDMLNWDISFIDNAFTVTSLPEFSVMETAPTENGVYVMKYTNNISPNAIGYYMDYSTGKITNYELNDENRKIFKQNYSNVDIRDRLSLKGSMICLDGAALTEMKALADGSVSADDTLLIGSEVTERNDTEYINIYAYSSLAIPAPYTPVELFIYLKTDSGYALVSKDAVVTKTAKLGNDTYINVQFRTGFRGVCYDYSTLYKVSSNGAVTCLNDKFPEHNSVSLVGTANGKVYLKCLWAPETQSNDNGERGLSVSAVNDGFFTYDGNKLTQIHKYLWCNDAFVTKNGDVYAVDFYRGVIRKVCNSK